MPILEFADDGLSKEVPAGTHVKDVADILNASLPFGCRSGLCGTCLSTVVEGMEHLSPRSADEEETLSTFDPEPNDRLACQLVVTGEPGSKIVIKQKDQ